MKKLFNLSSRLRWGSQYPSTQNTLIIFLSAVAKMQVIFWTEDHFWFISHRTNLFNYKLKKLINEQIIFYSPSNVFCSSDESVQIHVFFSYRAWSSLKVKTISVLNFLVSEKLRKLIFKAKYLSIRFLNTLPV